MSTDLRIEAVIKLANQLVDVLQADIAALEAGKPRDMQILEPQIQTLCAEYVRETAKLKRDDVVSAPGNQRARLSEATKRFQEALKLHTRVLQRIRNASEGLIKAVADEVEKRRNRARPYGSSATNRPVQASKGPSSLLYNAVV